MTDGSGVGMMFDLMIRNGLVIDGTGSPGFYAAILVSENRITVHRGDASELGATTVIDATGCVVAPGFIDLHSHGGLTILSDPQHAPKVCQGVTTELFGVDGIAHAPFKSAKELERYIWLDSGVHGYPPPTAQWLSVADYLDQYDRRVAVNVAYILGNSPVRIWSVGWNDRAATRRQLSDMQSVVREAMEEGAWGISIGLDYPPGSYADTAEIVALAQVAGKLGGIYHTHTRGSLRRVGLLAPWKEALEIGRRSGIAVHLTHYRQSAQGVGSHLEYLDLVERARDEGLDVTFDCYPYPYLGSSATFDLPQWTKDGGPEQLMKVLHDPVARARMRAEMANGLDIDEWSQRNWLTNFTLEANATYDGRSLREIADMRSEDPIDALASLLIDENLGISLVGLGTNPDTLAAFVSHPYGMIASDSLLLGDHPSPRSYGCFPLVLAEFVRAEKHLRLPEAIRKMTSFPAQRLGIVDRGILRDGYRADMVVFNPETVKTTASRVDPRRYPTGIECVIVNGEVVVRQGTPTGLLPGRVLRRGRRE